MITLTGRKEEDMIENKLIFNKKSSVIDRIKGESIPLVMYGAGTMALDVLDILNGSGIDIDCVVVDDEYYSEGDTLKGLAVKPLSRISDEYDRFNIILGRADYTKAETLNGMAGLANVFYLTSPIYKMTDDITDEDIAKYKEIYDKTYELLADDLSKKVFLSHLNARINDDASMIFPFYNTPQSYFKNDIWTITDDCCFLDIGAYTGDTVRQYRSINEDGHIWAFEADKTNYEKVRATVRELNITNIETFNNALWSTHTRAYWGGPEKKNRETGFVDTSGAGEQVELYTVDELMEKRSRKVGLLKINFPGAEEVIKGAYNIIKEDYPYLALRVGFNKHEIATVPLWIKENFPSYKLYMRYNMCIPAGLCLYGVSQGV